MRVSGDRIRRPVVALWYSPAPLLYRYTLLPRRLPLSLVLSER